MADFCQQCSLHIFGEDFRELADITSQEDWDADRANCVLCEGCGPIMVDPEGRCISDCMEHHGTSAGSTDQVTVERELPS